MSYETDEDPAMQPVNEAGGGVAEGFEQAEQDLIDNAEHGEGHGTPRSDQFGVEAEENPATYGEADEVEASERTDDDR